MPNDYITLKALVKETEFLLSEGRINKVTMPSPSEVLLAVRAKGENRALYISAAANRSCIRLTNTKFPTAESPLPFCMLLRKHLTGGMIESIGPINNDRIISLNVLSRNELRDAAGYRLIAEIMGGSSNIILTDENYTVIDAARRVYGEGARCILPGYPYEPPKSSKAPPEDENTVAELEKIPAEALADEIEKRISGLSKETVREAVILAKDIGVTAALSLFSNIYGSDRFSPSVLEDSGTLKGYYIMPYKSVSEGKFISMPTLNEAADLYFSTSLEKEIKQKETKDLRVALKRLKAKTDKKIAENLKKLEECSKLDELLQTAEILKCNIFNMEKSQSIIKCYDFYNNREIEIPLDPKLPPKKNVELYYKKYNKMKGAKLYAEKEKEELKALKDYLSSIEAGLENSETPDDYREIKRELAALLPKRQGERKQKEKKAKPLSLNIGGFTVYIGKNNIQNDYVTFSLADGGDLWLHTKNSHGAHTIIKSAGKEVPPSVLERAASYTAYMSEAKNGGKAEVEYTQRKNVKRLDKPGLVSYTKYKTVITEPQKPVL